MKPLKETAAVRAPLTMGDLVDLIKHDLELFPTKRRDLVSSIGKFVECLGRDLTLPADFMVFRQLMKRSPAIPEGVRSKRWSNIKTDVKFALARYGAPTRAPTPADLSDQWVCLRSKLTDISLQRGLSQFIHWCSRNGVAPEAVDDAVAARFLAHLNTATFERRPQTKFQRICVLWNRAASTVEGWPPQRVAVPCRRTRVSFPIETFPASFAADLAEREAVVSGRMITDPRTPPKALRPKTIAGQRRQIVRFASALVHSGYAIDQVTSIATLVTPDNFNAAINWYHNRFGGLRASLEEMAHTMVTLAKHYIGLPQNQLDELKAVQKRLRCRKRGMTDQNRERLRPFLQEEVQYQWLILADRLVTLSKKATSPKKAALLVQQALVHDLLIVAPMRWENLVGLNLDRHFRYGRHSRNGTVYIAIPGDEVKNGEPQEFELPPDVADLWRRYCESHRLILVNDIDDGWLFPGDGRRPKHGVTLSMQLTKQVQKQVGLKVNPHLYRHIAAFFYLQTHPEDLETVRRLLGHKSIDTTARYYGDFNRLTSIKHFQRYLSDREDELGGKLQDRAKSRAKRRRRT